MTNSYRIGLDKTTANYVPLTPLSFLERAASVYPNRLSIVHGERRFTWAQTYSRCRRLASSLARRGVRPGDTVSVMLSNTPEMYECHFGVPMAGAVLNTLNTRLDFESVTFMLEHAEARVIIADREYADTIRKAASRLSKVFLIVDVNDTEAPFPTAVGGVEYETGPGKLYYMPAELRHAVRAREELVFLLTMFRT